MSNTTEKEIVMQGIDDPREEEGTIIREDVEDSPFTLISIDGGKEFFGTMGKYRITDPGSKEELLKDLKEFNWNRIVQVMLLLLESTGNMINYPKTEIEENE